MYLVICLCSFLVLFHFRWDRPDVKCTDHWLKSEHELPDVG
jgi:hypothetical protein